jgi:fumarate reductase flavoprotein subunit
MISQIFSARALFVLSFIVTLVFVPACNTAPQATPLPPLPTVLATAVPPTIAPTAAATKPTVVAAKPGVARTVEDVTKTAATSPFMDGKHLAKNVACQACHANLSPVVAPETKTCLSCHKGSYTAMAEVTAKVNPNPHTSHEGEIPCVDCHKSHQPFVYGCGKAGCHTEYSSTRFK